MPVGVAGEFGKLAATILENKEKFIGKKISHASDYLTPNEIVAIFSKGIPLQSLPFRAESLRIYHHLWFR